MASRRHRLIQRRRALGLTQEQLAEHAGVDRSTVGRWERGESEPQPWQRHRLARTLQVSVEQLDNLLTPTDLDDTGHADSPNPHRDWRPDRQRRQPFDRDLIETAVMEQTESDQQPPGSWLPADPARPDHEQLPHSRADRVPRQIMLAEEVLHVIEEPFDEGLPYRDRLECLHQNVSRYSAAVATTAPAAMIGRITPDLIDAHQMLRYAQTGTDAVLLRSVLARLSAIVADELSVLGSIGPARSWHATAMAAADRTESRSLRADIRALGAMLPLYHGRQSEAIQLAQQAQQLAGTMPRFASPLASMLEAIARARLGDHDRALAALRQARTAYDKMDDAETVESFFSFSVRRRLFYEGRLLTIVGDYATAEAAHQQARDLYPQHIVGDIAIMNLDRATALISLNQVEDGANLISATLLNLPADHRTGIFLTLAARAFDTIPVPARRLTAARECAELLDSMESVQ